jgi:hypothetical protein
MLRIISVHLHIRNISISILLAYLNKFDMWVKSGWSSKMQNPIEAST